MKKKSIILSLQRDISLLKLKFQCFFMETSNSNELSKFIPESPTIRELFYQTNLKLYLIVRKELADLHPSKFSFIEKLRRDLEDITTILNFILSLHDLSDTGEEESTNNSKDTSKEESTNNSKDNSKEESRYELSEEDGVRVREEAKK